jgi:hypothetical protein
VSVNPPGGGAAPADIAALITQELAALAADAQTLATQLLPGDVVPAIVLPSNGLTDLLSVNGLRVAAVLPPSLLPGDNITVVVTGFDGERINLHIVPRPQPAANEAPNVTVQPATAGPASTIPAASATPAPLVSPPAAGATAAPAARASVAPAPNAGPAVAGGKPVSGTTASAAPARSAGAPQAVARAPAAEYGPRSAVVPVRPVLKTIEARLAAAHAAAVPAARPSAPAPTAQGARSAAPPAGQPASASVARPQISIRAPLSPPVSTPAMTNARPATPPATTSRPPAAPATKSKSPFGAKPRLDVARLPPSVEPTATRPPIGIRAPAVPVSAAAVAAAPASEPAAVPRGPAAFAEPAVLLRALHLAVTPTNLTLARMALESPEKLPNALAALERALANDADPRVATLSTLTSFIARIDPRSPVLAAQIAAFVDHVVTGREARIAQLASAANELPARADPHAKAAIAPALPGREPHATAGAERIAVVRAALDYDLKSQLLTVAAERAAGTDSAGPKAAGFDRAVAGVLSAITALQLNAASTLNASPDGLAFSVPMALPDGFANAQVRIDRDAPNGRKTPLDGDNFHIAFVLETRHLGTVAIDVMTVGRAVTLSVKTEAVLAQRVFAGALERLSARLESLRYRVVKADAAVAPPAAAEAPSSRPVPGPAADAARLVDVDA